MNFCAAAHFSHVDSLASPGVLCLSLFFFVLFSTGEFCQYKTLDASVHGDHGRFVGGSKCEHGTVVKKNTTVGATIEECRCDAGYYGYHCHFQACQNGGKRSCPRGNAFCARKICLCKRGYVGESCGNINPDMMFVNGTAVYRNGKGGAGTPGSRHGKSNHRHGGLGGTSSSAAAAAGGAATATAAATQCQQQKCSMYETFDAITCRCTCKEGRSGSDCTVCASSATCDGGNDANSFRTMDAKTCTCQCPYSTHADDDDEGKEQMKCLNGGTFDDVACTCHCPTGFRGAKCETCAAKRSCHGHGIWSNKQCQCICRPPWLKSSDCEQCGTKQQANCGPQGHFNAKKCKFVDGGGWYIHFVF